MLSRSKILLTGVVIIPFVFVLAVRLNPYFVAAVTKLFPRVRYRDDSDASDVLISMLIFFLIYSIVAFYRNVKVLRSVGRLGILSLSIQAALDLALIPISILIMAWLYRGRTTPVDVSSLLNPIAISVVHIFKQIMVGLIPQKK